MDQSNTSSSLPKPKDLSHLLSKVTKSRPTSNIKAFYKYFAIPGIGQLAGGLPAPEYFPYDTLEAKVALPERWKPTPNDPVDPPTGKVASLSVKHADLSSSRVMVPWESGVVDMTKKIDLTSALQYGQAQGYPPLYEFLKQFTRENMHPNVPYAGGPDIILTCGSTDGFNKALSCFHDDWIEGRDALTEKDGLLVEEFAYMNAVQAAKPKGMNIVPVTIDDEGMLASGKGGLQDVLENWDTSKGRRPHMMYTVTMGQNPTSGVLSIGRRKEIYSLCSKYDIIIVEDDPYWYLQYPSANPFASAPVLQGKSSGFKFLDSLVPSYLSVDTDGRVVRLDTFSKTVAPGCRMGWITAQPAVCERLLRITETSTQQPSGFVQAMISELLMGPQTPTDPGRGGAEDGSGWDVSGWVRWLEGLRGNYERRMNTMVDILEKGKYQVKSGRRRSLAWIASDDGDDNEEWTVIEKTPLYTFAHPMGGMFLWLRVNFASHPLFHRFAPPDFAKALWIHWTQQPYLVLVTPGAVFSPTPEIAAKDGWRFFRICFAACKEEDVAKCTRRFVEGIQAFWRLKKKEDVEALLKDVDAGVSAEQMGQNLRALLGPC